MSPATATGQSNAVVIVRIIGLVVITLALGATVLYCIMRVGELHEQIAVVQVCLDANETIGCTSLPTSAAQITNLRNEADTTGMVGWFSFFLCIFVVGSRLMDTLRRK